MIPLSAFNFIKKAANGKKKSKKKIHRHTKNKIIIKKQFHFAW